MRLVYGLLLVACTSCALPTRQTDALVRDYAVQGLPETHEIANVGYIKQTENYCGPATLTMAMNRAGHVVTVEEIAGEVYTPGKKGSLQQDLISSSRRQGMMAVSIQGLPALLQEVNAGHPVIVFMNLGLSWYPIYHYALIYGYDLREPEVVMHSGGSKGKHWSMRKFERNWALGNYWGLVVLPPGELAPSADELAHAVAASGLEQVGHVAAAEQAYRLMLTRWPQSFGAEIGLGNLSYGRGDFLGAVKVLREAAQAHPESSVVWHNLATAEGAAGDLRAARMSTQKALALAAPEEKPVYEESLKAWAPKKP